jgi:acetylornithine/succinyldiaminopimelate/putrescine aminotransferase
MHFNSATTAAPTRYLLSRAEAHHGNSPMNAINLEACYCAHNYEPIPVVLTRGQGAYLWDTAGRCYIDMMSAYSAASHGHSHPRILAALE